MKRAFHLAFHGAFQIPSKAFHFRRQMRRFISRAYKEIETVKRGVNVSHPVSHHPGSLPMDTAFHFTARPVGDRETQTTCGMQRRATA